MMSMQKLYIPLHPFPLGLQKREMKLANKIFLKKTNINVQKVDLSL